MTPRDGARGSERPRRIVVVGTSNAGKSTLAARLARSLDAPFVELDALYWRPNWTGARDDEFAAQAREATSGDAWVVDGYYRRVVQPFLWPRAQLVIWLDLPLRVTFPRLLARSWRRWRTHELLWGTNREAFSKHLKLWDQEQSLIASEIFSRQRWQRRFFDEMLNPRWNHLRFVRLCSPSEVEAFARGFEAAAR